MKILRTASLGPNFTGSYKKKDCRGLSKYIEIKVHTTCFYLFVFTFYKAFKKTKGGLELVSLSHFLHDFWRKSFVTLYSINWPNFIVRLTLLLGILGNMYIIIVCFPGCDVIDFEINLNVPIKPFSHMTNKKSGQKLKYLKNEKSF